MRALAPVGAALLALAMPVAAQATSAPTDPELTALQARDQRLFAIGWRLATGNAAYCEGAEPALGLMVLDADSFGDPGAVRRQLGLSGDLAIDAVAAGSPAAAAGLSANDTLVALDGAPLASNFPSSDPAWQRLIDVTAALSDAAARGPVALTAARAGTPNRTVTLSPVPACPSRFEVLDHGSRASAEGTRVIFGKDFVGFTYPEDEFAAAIAHEFAHNLLRHRARLDALGRTQARVRITEREADRLMPWLLANAGYDPAAAERFMAHWGPGHDGGLFRTRDHDGWDERVATIRAEVGKVEAALAKDHKADWARGFAREALD